MSVECSLVPEDYTYSESRSKGKHSDGSYYPRTFPQSPKQGIGKDKIYVPAREIIFDHRKRFLIYEASKMLKIFKFMKYPFHLFGFSGCFIAANFAYLENGLMYFLYFGGMAGMMHIWEMMSGCFGSTVKSIKLIANFEDEVVEELEIENIMGQVEVVKIKDIQQVPKSHVLSVCDKMFAPKFTYPIFVEDLLMFIDFRGTYHNIDLFRAVMNQHKIDLSRVQSNGGGDYEDDSDWEEARDPNVLTIEAEEKTDNNNSEKYSGMQQQQTIIKNSSNLKNKFTKHTANYAGSHSKK